MRKLTVLVSIVFFLLILVSCSAEPEKVEVTRVVREVFEVEATRVVEVEVTRPVEVTRVVSEVSEVEVTRVVEVEVTRPDEVTRVVVPHPTPTTESGGSDRPDPSLGFAANYVGKLG